MLSNIISQTTQTPPDDPSSAVGEFIQIKFGKTIVQGQIHTLDPIRRVVLIQQDTPFSQKGTNFYLIKYNRIIKV